MDGADEGILDGDTMNLPDDLNQGLADTELEIRSATDQDFAFLRQLHSQVMREHIERLFGWDGEFQRKRLRKYFDPERTWLIYADDRRIGVVGLVKEEEGSLHVRQFYLMEDWQNRGIGTRIMEALNTAADRTGTPLTLKVLKQSPAARLYRRVGFEPCGDTEYQNCFRREARTRVSPQDR